AVASGGGAASPASGGGDGGGVSPAPAAPRGKAAADQHSGIGATISDMLWGTSRRQGMVEAMAKSTARTVGSSVGRQILRGVLGGIFGGPKQERKEKIHQG